MVKQPRWIASLGMTPISSYNGDQTVRTTEVSKGPDRTSEVGLPYSSAGALFHVQHLLFVLSFRMALHIPVPARTT